MRGEGGVQVGGELNDERLKWMIGGAGGHTHLMCSFVSQSPLC